MNATATLRPAASGLRAGVDDNQQHTPGARSGVAVCGAAIKPDQRFDRPDWPRCLECIDRAGIVVDPPTVPAAIPELEQRALFGDR